MAGSPDHRDDVTLTVAQATELDRLMAVFDVAEEHVLDPGLLTYVYSS